MRIGSRRPLEGFTLIELMIVILIIGLMASFILVVSFEGIRRAEERATQALITKLEIGLEDRIQSLLTARVTANAAHLYMAAIPTNPTLQPWGVQGEQRAQVIARVDQIKAELPDVFFVQDTNPSADGYPINFAGRPYPLGATGNRAYILPLGNSVFPAYIPNTYNPMNGQPINLGPGAGTPDIAAPGAPGGVAPHPGTGIFGASYLAAAGIYKNLGNVPQDSLPSGATPQPYLPSGYDGVDNNQNGLIDEWAEGVNASNLDAVRQSLLNHTHETARSEMLYALLVEGPYNVFNRDDFTAREVGDTDGDGLPEFLDAWGKPLQFYRWPLYYTSDLQKGSATYNGPFETRQQNPLDPNQQLLAPAWWANRTVTTPGSGQVSTRAALFQNYFFSLIDPLADPPMGTVVPNTAYWDRSALSSSGISYRRRAYFFKFLIASAGPNQRMGIARYADATVRTGGPTSPDVVAASLILIENQAARSDLNRNAGSAMPPLYQAEGAPLPDDEGADDITNHTLNAPGTGLR